MQRALPLLILAIVLIASLVLFLPESAQKKASQIDPFGAVSSTSKTLPSAAIPTREKAETSRRGLGTQVSSESAPLPAPVISGAAITLQVWDRATQTPVAFADLFLAPKESNVAAAERRPGFHNWLEEHAGITKLMRKDACKLHVVGFTSTLMLNPRTVIGGLFG